MSRTGPYTGNVDLINGLRRKNDGDFFLVDSPDVRTGDGISLQNSLEDMIKINDDAEAATKIQITTTNEDVDIITIQDFENIVADEFVNNKVYSIGQYVLYEENLYKFIVAHNAGAWNSNQVIQVKTCNEIRNINRQMKDCTGNFEITGWTDYTDKKYVDLSSSPVSMQDGEIILSTSTSSNLRCVVIEASENDIFTISTVGGGSNKAYAFIKSTGEIIYASPSYTSYTNERVVCPADTAFFVVNDRYETGYVYSGELLKDKVNENINKLSHIVTPEMFGAIGDGVNNDTSAILNAITNGDVIVMNGKYYFSSPITLSAKKKIICNGILSYHGSGSAIIVTTSYCDVYIRKLETIAHGIELRPAGVSSVGVNCSMNIIKCDEIFCLGDGGIGLHLNCNNGCIQFCNFTINRLQGGWATSNNIGIKIDTTQSYCNGNVFNIHSICFFARALYITSSNGHNFIENIFNNITFEGNSYSIYANNCYLNGTMELAEDSAGRVYIDDGVSANIKIISYMKESQIYFPVVDKSYNSVYHFTGNIIDNAGNLICRDLYITEFGHYAVDAMGPFNTSQITSLNNLFGYATTGSISDGGSYKIPYVKTTKSKCPLAFYDIYYTSAKWDASFTLITPDGTEYPTQLTKAQGVIRIVTAPDDVHIRILNNL